MPHLTADEDARLMIAAVKAGVPAPKVRAILEDDDGLGPGYITEFVAGETLATKILREENFAKARAMMTKQCGKILAAIHRIPLGEVPFLAAVTPLEMVAAHRQDHRLLRISLRRRSNSASSGRRRTLRESTRHTVVHGDFRHGNFIVGEEGIRLVLDWEVAHSGDPMEDLGWVCVKTWRFGGRKPVGGFGTREDLFEAYEKASGHSASIRSMCDGGKRGAACAGESDACGWARAASRK